MATKPKRTTGFTPLHLEILLHALVQGTPFPRSSEGITEYRDHLVLAGLIELETDTDVAMTFVITDKGRAWLDRALSTPLPTMKWVW